MLRSTLVAKLILLAVALAPVLIPLRTARDPSPRRGLRRAVVAVALLVAFYALSIQFVIDPPVIPEELRAP